MFKNKLYLGSIAGVVATIAKDILNQGIIYIFLLEKTNPKHLVEFQRGNVSSKEYPLIVPIKTGP